jgi:tRNA1Val (adenine37-N6)-methyltransferase
MGPHATATRVRRNTTLHDPELGPLTDDRLTRDYRVFQRQKGHRFSSDDMVTAYVAFAARPAARRVVDLGCGLGSVLLHLAWKLPEASLWGIEAQDSSFALLRRNVERNGLSDRVHIQHGDLRDGALLAALGEGQFELVTGTPPYFPPDTAIDAEDPQRAYARIEYRGGVEAYLAAGARLLQPDGTMVLCGDAGAEERVRRGAERALLHLRARCEVLPRAERPALFSVWTLTQEAGACLTTQLTLRDAAGGRTADAQALRAFSGFTEKP